jgi:hypothetical protein
MGHESHYPHLHLENKTHHLEDKMPMCEGKWLDFGVNANSFFSVCNPSKQCFVV